MLTNDATNRLYAIDDAMALVTLMDELIGARKPDAELSLTSTAASGLSLVLGHVVEVLGDAATGLRKASEEITTAKTPADHSSDAHRRGYTEGYADAAREQAPTAVHRDDYLSGVRMGARVAYGAGWRDAGGAIGAMNEDWRQETVDALIEASLEERAEAAADYKRQAAAILNDILDTAGGEAPTPTLTEAVSPQEQEQAIPTEPRQRA